MSINIDTKIAYPFNLDTLLAPLLRLFRRRQGAATKPSAEHRPAGSVAPLY